MKTTTIKTKVTSILLVIVMMLSIMPLSAFAADTKPSYVALGDSISTGYGLANKTAQGFTYLLADELDYELTNLAVDGNTAAGILAQLQQQPYKNAVAGADLITITAGGNDLMALLYQAIAAEYNKLAVAANNPISADEVLVIMSDSSDGRRLTVMSVALGLLKKDSDIYLLDDDIFTNAIANYISTLNLVLSAIESLNDDATVIVATQYNPYVEFDGAAVDAIFTQIDLTPICDGMEDGVTALNTAIKNNAATGRYIVADVKAAFDTAHSATNDLYVADPVIFEFDFHPNAAGHTVLADIFAAAVPSAPVSVSAVSSNTYRGNVSGGGEFMKGDQVTLTATPAHEDHRFCYWLDNSVELPEEPTEAQLKEAIVSYDSTYTFTAEKDISLTAVFAYKAYLYLTRMGYETRADYTVGEMESGIRLDEEDIRIEIGNAPVTVEKTAFADTVTVGGAIYTIDSIILANYNENEEAMDYQLLESFSVPVAPIYDSIEYWRWFGQYEQSLTVAYLRHTHAYATKYDANGHWNECTCKDKTAVQPHSFANDADTACDCGYERHVHTYETKYDENGHWTKCACGDKTDVQPHSFTDDADTACDCGYERHVHTYETKYDENDHWTECACGDKTDVQRHSFTKGFKSCVCGYYRKGIDPIDPIDVPVVGVLNGDDVPVWTYFDPSHSHDEIKAEIAVVRGQQPVDATVKVKFYNENEVPSDDAEKIRDYANSKFSDKTYAFEWMDISLIGEDGNPIRELDSPLAFGFDMAGRNVLGVASVHNGTLVHFDQLNGWDWSTPNIPIWAYSLEVIGETDLEKTAERLVAMGRLSPEMAVLIAGRFSTYAIIYEVEPTPDTPSSPQTGDNSHMALWLALLFISGGAIITLTVYDRKRKAVK